MMRRPSLTLVDLSADGDRVEASTGAVGAFEAAPVSTSAAQSNPNEPSNPSSSEESHFVNDWSATYGIFDLWDVDGSNSLSTDEVEYGIKLIFLNSTCPQLSYMAVSRILAELRMGHSDKYVLDRQTFGYFFFKLSKAANMPIEELAGICSHNILGGGDVKRSSSHLGRAVISQQKSYNTCIDFGVSSNLSTELDNIHLLFDLIDLNNDGTLQANELSSAIEPLFLTSPSSPSSSNAKIGPQECMELKHNILDSARIRNTSDGLNRHGFGVFLSRLSLVMGLSLESITALLLKDAQTRHAKHNKEVEEFRKRNGMETEEYRVAYNHISELFDLWDADGSGSLDRSEIGTVCQRLIEEESLTITFQEVLLLFREVDDGSQELDVREFGCFVLKFTELSGLPLDELVILLMNHAREFQQEELNRSFRSREGNRLHNPLEGVVAMMKSFSSLIAGPTKEERLCHYLAFNASSACDSDEERGIEPDFIEPDESSQASSAVAPIATKYIDYTSDTLFGDSNKIGAPETVLPRPLASRSAKRAQAA